MVVDGSGYTRGLYTWTTFKNRFSSSVTDVKTRFTLAGEAGGGARAAQTVCILLSAEDCARLAAVLQDRNRLQKYVQRAKIVSCTRMKRPLVASAIIILAAPAAIFRFLIENRSCGRFAQAKPPFGPRLRRGEAPNAPATSSGPGP